MTCLSAKTFADIVKADPINAELLRRLPQLELNQCYLTAGCLFQAVWNQVSGHGPGWGVRDYDVFYFDDGDLSWDAEDAVIRRVESLCADLSARIEVKNQARVHLWYESRFRAHYPKLTSAREGIDRFLIACTCVGVDIDTHYLYAPHGLFDLQAGILRPNPLSQLADRFAEKAKDYQARWPWLTIST